jgi:hypothetical protein
MFSKSLLVLLSCLALIGYSCQPAKEETVVRAPGAYHIRLELGNYWAGRENELYFDCDSTQTKQQIHYFKYDATDSIVYNQSYEIDKAMMDSVFIYASGALRNAKLFEVDKYQPKDVNTLKLEIIANERMLGCSYNNVLKPSLLSPEFNKLVKMINKCMGDSTLVK